MFYAFNFHITYLECRNMQIKNKIFSTFKVYIQEFITELEKLLTHTSKKFYILNNEFTYLNFVLEYEKLVSKVLKFFLYL